MNKHNLTQETYFSDKSYLSASKIKSFLKCEAEALYGAVDENKDCFIEGHLFETLLTGTSDEIALFEAQNSQLYSSRGDTKGMLKSNFKVVENAVERVKQEQFLMDIIDKAEKQVILTGEIMGYPFKMMCDLLMPDGSIYDIKCMKDFKHVYSPSQMCYVDWWEAYNYHIQLWIYKEIARQNGIGDINSKYGLIGVSKEKVTDISAIQFSNEIMEVAETLTYNALARINQIENGDKPINCGTCDYCKANKHITEFELI